MRLISAVLVVEPLETATRDRKIALVGDEKGPVGRGHIGGRSGGCLASLGAAVGSLPAARASAISEHAGSR
jgi:hypothetical protein